MREQIKSFVHKAKDQGLYILEVSGKEGDESLSWSRFGTFPRFETYSISKTFTAAAVGLAMEDGLFAKNTTLGELFPQESKNAPEFAKAITIENLLTMTAGLEKTIFWKDGYERTHVKDWVPYFFEKGEFTHQPGTVYQYNNACTYMLSASVSKLAGKNVREFLRPRLFEPLGIGNVEWGDDPNGITFGCNGLCLSAPELRAYGELLLKDGLWEGTQLLPKVYVQAMHQVYNEVEDELPGSQRWPGYGYQTWIDRDHDMYFLWGIFGQYCLIQPKKQSVVAFTSMEINDGGCNGNYSASSLRKLIWEEFVL